VKEGDRGFWISSGWCHTVAVALFIAMTEFPIKLQGLNLIGANYEEAPALAPL
jgi:hypothetical protein